MPERACKHTETKSSPCNVGTVEQFLRGPGADSSRMSPTYSSNCSSPCSPMKHQDMEEDHGLYQKKSVLTKVKQKARKFCNSLSKRRMEDDNITPSWGVTLEDDEEEEEEEEDAEYLGAPMYESELAPEAYKENARQHPRANPVISEKHVLHNTITLGMQQDQDQEKPRAAVNRKLTSTTQPDSTTTAAPNLASETLAQKLIPVYTGGSVAANSISSKIQNAVSKNPLVANSMPSQNASVSSSPLQNLLSSSASQSRKNTSQNGASVKEYMLNKSEQEDGAKTVSPKQYLSSSSASMSGKNTRKSISFKDSSMNRSERGNDARTVTPLQKSSSLSAASMRERNTSQRNASAKDYSMSESEPRDDEKTASQLQAISERTGPSKTSSNAGVMEKVRGAVNSLLGNEEPSQEYGVKIPTTRTSSQTQQVDQDENRGRILQAN